MMATPEKLLDEDCQSILDAQVETLLAYSTKVGIRSCLGNDKHEEAIRKGNAHPTS